MFLMITSIISLTDDYKKNSTDLCLIFNKNHLFIILETDVLNYSSCRNI